jgi:Ulp1 protease family, C-terminal catalytic domain
LYHKDYTPKSITVFAASQLVSSVCICDDLLDALMLEAATTSFLEVMLISALTVGHWNTVLKSSMQGVTKPLAVEEKHRSRPLWLLPFHDNERHHWYLVVFNMFGHHAYILDSCPKATYVGDIAKMKNLVSHYGQQNFEYKRLVVPVQENDFDCGLLVYKMAKEMLKSPESFQAYIDRMYVEGGPEPETASPEKLRSDALLNLLKHDPLVYQKRE